ncbi:LemA family protein, partial [SCandidatus Aminicenantes bacterium Aminicenantia_JdfR_composite]|nr:LemA family protein [SCandidatus Aminicenantes bacterium Aminicenantia_JdfR_composite]
MSKTTKRGIIIFIIVLLIGGILFATAFVRIYNRLNILNQAVLGGKSLYSSALNLCSQKVKAVWAMADQISDKETEAQKAIARARTGFEQAEKLFKTALESGKGIEELTRAATGVLRSTLAIRVQLEAYPVITSVSTYNQAMRGVEEGINEIKTALDDWIMSIRNYNTYRKSFWVDLIASIFSGKFSVFPQEYNYYEGPIEELD